MRILVAEPDGLFRDGLLELLVASGYRSVIATDNGPETLEKARSERAEVLLLAMDLDPSISLDLLRVISAELPRVKSLLLAEAGDDRKISEGLCGGARGFVVRGRCPEELPLALACLESGVPFGTPRLARALSRAVSTTGPVVLDCSEKELETLRDLQSRSMPGTIPSACAMGVELRPTLDKLHDHHRPEWHVGPPFSPSG